MLVIETMSGISINEDKKKEFVFKCWNGSDFLPNNVSYTAYIFLIEDNTQLIKKFINFSRFRSLL